MRLRRSGRAMGTAGYVPPRARFVTRFTCEGAPVCVPAPRQPTRGPGDAERHRLGYDRAAVSRDAVTLARHVAGAICPERPPAVRPRPRLPHPPDLGLSEALMPVHLGGHAPIRPAYCWVTDLSDHPPITPARGYEMT